MGTALLMLVMMIKNRLQSNPDKTEVVWCTTNRCQNQLSTTPLTVEDAAVTPVKSTFLVVCPKIWNALLDDVTSPSLNAPFAASSKCGFSGLTAS